MKSLLLENRTALENNHEEQREGIHIALEGDAGCGKTTVATVVQESFVERGMEFRNLSTGAIFRALAYCKIMGLLPLPDAKLIDRTPEEQALLDAQMEEIIAQIPEDFITMDREGRVSIQGTEVSTARLSEPDVSALVAVYASSPATQYYGTGIVDTVVQELKKEGINVITEGRCQKHNFSVEPDLLMFISRHEINRALSRSLEGYRKTLQGEDAVTNYIKRHTVFVDDGEDTEKSAYWTSFNSTLKNLRTRDRQDEEREALPKFTREGALANGYHEINNNGKINEDLLAPDIVRGGMIIKKGALLIASTRSQINQVIDDFFVTRRPLVGAQR